MTRADAPAPANDEPAPDSLALSQIRADLESPPAQSNLVVWLFVSLGFFLLAGSRSTITDLLVLVGVIGFHEGGHALAMKAFGYRDVRVFFVPFFGGAAMGKKVAAPAWQRAVVLFSGPLPGIVVGIALVFASVRMDDPEHAQQVLKAASILIAVNGFNLLPMPPLDGGRLFELALFSRHLVLEVGFALLSALALAALAATLRSIGLGVLAALLIFGLPHRARLRSRVDALRTAHGTFPNTPAAVPAQALLALDRAATEVSALRPQARANNLRAMWEQLASPTASKAASAGILGAWLLAVVVTLAGTVLLAIAADGAQGTDP